MRLDETFKNQHLLELVVQIHRYNDDGNKDYPATDQAAHDFATDVFPLSFASLQSHKNRPHEQGLHRKS